MKWLSVAHVVRVALPPVAGLILGALVAVGVVDPQVAAELQHKLFGSSLNSLPPLP
jgi:hypothetical protein